MSAHSTDGGQGSNGRAAVEGQNGDQPDNTFVAKLIEAMQSASSSVKTNHFGGIAMNKDDSFPKLHVTNASTGVSNRIPADEGLAWMSNADAWFSSHGAMGFFQLAEQLITLDEDGKQLKQLFPGHDELEDLSASAEGMRRVLMRVSKTTFGNHVLMPFEQDIKAMSDNDVRRMYSQFNTVCSQLSYRLRVAATAQGATATTMHDLFGASNVAIKGKNGEQHSLAGLILLEQIRLKFQKDPQGTSLQMKNKLLAKVNATIPKVEFTLYSIEQFMHKVDATLTNILSKEPTLKSSLEMEVNTAMLAVLRAACRRTRANHLGNAEDVLDAAESIGTELTETAKQIKHVTWCRFQGSVFSMLAMHLPPEAIKPKKHDPIQQAMALLSNTGYTLVADSTPAGNAGQKKSGSGNDKQLRILRFLESWVCEKCGNKGHKKHQCTNPANPNADKMVEKAREEKRVAREVREKKTKQRSNMQRQGEELARRNQSEQNTPNKRQKTTLPTTEVDAGLARIDYNDTLGNMDEQYDAQYDDEEEQDNQQEYNYYNGSGFYTSSYTAVLEEDSNPALTLVLLFCTSILGLVMNAMTPASITLNALGQVNIGAVVYVILMSLLQMYVPDLHGSAYQVASSICASICMTITLALCWTAYCGAVVLGVFKGNVPNAEKAVYVDSGCTHSVFFSKEKLHNLRAPDREYIIKGVSGQIRVTRIGDFPLSLRDEKGQTYTKYVIGCLFAPDAKANLLSAADLGKIGVGFTMQPHKANGRLFMEVPGKGTLFFPLIGVRGLQQLPFFKDTMTCISGVSTHHLRALTEAEIWHMRMGHASSRKIAKLSTHCKGIARPLAENSFPCHACHEAKAEHSDAPPQSSS